jgi:sarcosine oxidase gamma subunit
MSDRSTFWPAPPDWATARIEAPGATVTASHGDRGVFLLSGSGESIAALAKAHAGTLLPIAPDRAMLVTEADAGMQDGWHQTGLAISDLSDAHIRIDIRGPAATALLALGSPSLAIDPKPRAAAVGFAGMTLLVEPLEGGARLHVERPQAPHLWHWLLAATHSAKDQP